MKSRDLLVVTARDEELLLFVALSRYVSQEQLALTFFSSADRCRKRTKRLVDAQFLRCILVDSRSARLFAVTQRGLSLLARSFPDLAARLRLPGGIQIAGVAHHLGIVWARLYIAALAEAGLVPSVARSLQRCAPRAAQGVAAPPAQHDSARRPQAQSLVLFAQPGERVVEEMGFGDLKLRPDAVAEVGNSDGVGHVRIGIEIDLASEGLRVIESKLERYTAAFGNGLLTELWFVVDGDARHRRVLELIRSAATVARASRVLTLSTLKVRPIAPPPPTVHLTPVEGEKAKTDPPPSQSYFPAQRATNSRGHRDG